MRARGGIPGLPVARYDRAMFPDGFELQSESGGYRLVLNGRGIALATQLGNGRCRLCLHCDHAGHMRHDFTDSMAAGVRYLERWATRWEAELRKLYAQPRPRAYW